MLRKLISTALRRETADDMPSAAAGDPAAGAMPDMEFPPVDFPPMTPLRPPEAQNDNPLSAFCAGVEADLRAAGYLR